MALDRWTADLIYRSMLRSRQLETALIQAVAAGKPAHVGHPASGQEAVAAGVCAALRPDDHLYCAHRAKHWALSKGSRVDQVAGELWGKRSGLAKGLGGEMHMLDAAVGFMGSSHIVGGTLPVAVGSALAARLDGTDRVTVVAFGDGASVQGTFHEALNLAAIWDLPVLFVCENNQYAESTPVEYFSRPSEIHLKAVPYGMPSVRIDGQDALAVFDAVNTIVCDMRRDHRPRFVEALTYRYLGHFYGDKTRRYRTEEEEARWAARDPIALFEADAFSRGLVESSRLTAIRDEVVAEVSAAMRDAEVSPYPDLTELHRSALKRPTCAERW